MASAPESDLSLFANMKSIMSLLDRLRDFKLDDYISLPRITVLGEQSAGKSSILESIVGMNFLPRGSGVVTRRPLELRLKKMNIAVPYFVFPRDFPGKKFTSQEEVCNTIEQLTDKVAGVDKFISSDPIVLEVFSASVPDLSLVDLPGITRIPIGRQPANIEEITKGLIKHYCASPDSLILCVIPANIDITTSDALLFARQLDPSGSRTLGVLTKIDLMDEGTDCLKVLLNQEVKLTHGFVGVKGRNQREVTAKKTVKDAIQAELDYFYRHPMYSGLPSELLGTSSLIGRLSKVLYEMVQSALPRIQREIVERKKRARDTLDALGDAFPETDEKKMELVFKLVRAFKESFDQDISGKYFFESTSAKGKAQRKRGETVTFQLNQLFAELYQEYIGKDFHVTEEYTDAYIQNAMDTYQGDSMPGFQSFDSFLFLITPKLRNLKAPIYQVLEEAKSILEIKGTELLEEVFKKYARLQGEVRDTFLRVLSQTKMRAQKILDNLVRCEENYLFTNNPQMLEGATLKRDMKKTAVNLMVTELRFRIDAYFNITVRNIRNTVPKVVGQFLLRRLSENLEVEILNALSKRNYCLDGFAESDTSADLRTKTRAELTSLTAAENLLINEFGMTFGIGGDLQERGASRGRPTTELGAEFLEDIDRLNEDFLSFNVGLLKLGGQTAKPGHEFGLRKSAPRENGPVTKVNGGRDESAPPMKPNPNASQASLISNQPVNVAPNRPAQPVQQQQPQTQQQRPATTNPQQINPNVQIPDPMFGFKEIKAPQQQGNFQGQPQQNQQQRPNTAPQNPQMQQQNQPWTQPQQQSNQNRQAQDPYNVNLFAQQQQQNASRPPNQQQASNAFLNFGSNRDKSPIRPGPNQQPPNQPQQPQGPQSQWGAPKPPVPPRPDDKTAKPATKYGNLFG